MIPITSSAVGAEAVFTFNFNGNETATDLTATIATLDTLAQTLTGYAVSSDVPALTNTFDQNRCAAVKIKWLPSLPNGAVTAGYQPTYLLRERDGIDMLAMPPTSTPFNFNLLQEQINGVKTLNMYRPFKTYMKATKYRINTRTPGTEPAYGTPNAGYAVNTNISGQWKRAGSLLTQSWNYATGTAIPYQVVARGPHLAIVFQRPAGLTGAFTLGNLEVTSYYVYKDRR